jgi:hypothetical protein
MLEDKPAKQKRLAYVGVFLGGFGAAIAVAG